MCEIMKSCQGVYIYITYPVNAIVKLAPGPDWVRIAHWLTVEYSTLALIFILTALVARYLRSSFKKKKDKSLKYV